MTFNRDTNPSFLGAKRMIDMPHYKVISYRPDPDTLARLKTYAEHDQRRSMNEVLNILVNRALDESERTQRRSTG